MGPQKCSLRGEFLGYDPTSAFLVMSSVRGPGRGSNYRLFRHVADKVSTPVPCEGGEETCTPTQRHFRDQVST
jgi:hypothetical protein